MPHPSHSPTWVAVTSAIGAMARIARIVWIGLLCMAGSALAAPPPTHTPVTHGITLNINEADAQALTTQLKGIGAVKAAAIVSHRERFGPFRTLGELTDVKGIGPRTVEKLSPFLRLE